jgi:hypothetical protein
MVRTFQVDGKETPDKGKVALEVHFASMTDMMEWLAGNLHGVAPRPTDAVDKVDPDRRFVATTEAEHLKRVQAFELAEVEF